MDTMVESSTTVVDSTSVGVPEIGGALKLVDKAIADISGRDLVSSSEMTDLLLDIRLYLMTAETQEVV